MEALLGEGFRKWAGKADVENIVSGQVLYAKQSLSAPDTNNFAEMHQTWFQTVRQQVFALWLLRDNAVDVKAFYIEIGNENEDTVIKTWGSMILSNAVGTRSTETFTLEELRTAFERYITQAGPLVAASRDSIAPSLTPRGDDLTMQWTRVVAQKGVPRFARFWHFIMTGRGTSDLGIKIANYCTALESMFTTDSNELVHKIAERVACFLRTTGTERKEVFRHIKEAYSLRSKVVHGDVIAPAKLKIIATVAKNLDGYLREIMNLILEDPSIQQVFNRQADGLSEYFEDLIFA